MACNLVLLCPSSVLLLGIVACNLELCCPSNGLLWGIVAHNLWRLYPSNGLLSGIVAYDLGPLGFPDAGHQVSLRVPTILLAGAMATFFACIGRASGAQRSGPVRSEPENASEGLNTL